MEKVITFMKDFGAAEDGVTMIEYGLLAALIAIVSIVAITTLGTTLQATFDDIAVKLGIAAG
jgi:pilus assembly protein Flp/PilA